MTIQIASAGLATTVQDQGRAGLAHLGVPRSGMVDPALGALVNRLVGNDPTAAVIETCGGLTLIARTVALIATSAELAPRSLRPGDRVTVAPGTAGRLWHYIAVRGGIDVHPVLGSRSADVLSALGPAALVDGDELAVGPDPGTPIDTDVAPLAALGDRARCSIGPRADWFIDGWETAFTSAAWTITTSSRVGVRLTGVQIERVIRHELPSEGLVRGAIQVPPDGDPVMMLADHPTTGGYPVIAVVHPDDVAIVAQHSAGTQIRFSMYG